MDEEVKESVLTRAGLSFLTEKDIRYIGFKKHGVSEKHYAHYLEL